MDLKLASAPMAGTWARVSIEPLWNWNRDALAVFVSCWRINRTFMELKLGNNGEYRAGLYVSIEPLWNWNFALWRFKGDNHASINRTFMELKLSQLASTVHCDVYQSNLYGIETIIVTWGVVTISVSIEPLWNWNLLNAIGTIGGARINRTFMELKHTTIGEQAGKGYSINRTFMELKHELISKGEFIGYVSIEPLWNWNRYTFEYKVGHDCINRTFMELKLYEKSLAWRSPAVSIEPLWNWNVDASAFSQIASARINRTFMELKLLR